MICITPKETVFKKNRASSQKKEQHIKCPKKPSECISAPKSTTGKDMGNRNIIRIAAYDLRKPCLLYNRSLSRDISLIHPGILRSLCPEKCKILCDTCRIKDKLPE